ncbi:MAG: hypothetical protein DWQ34_09945 [Planctomycetota bacterium]|nr:MAG: hypothetical protein DWQ29_18960 [Planctomycetota bacterium]REJ93818.1 MAG: hypothetical protein DWQ34_09945 [Planctomycetota bacterium]REK21154.1 MAG: hypothetical protein DWQ41_22335 [Planctomycetota bacterium]REK29562.1 MAG: hypothetical protein DWQ45_22370 [Planctomycetota bacterium]
MVTDGVHECIAFSHPCTLKIGASLDEPLHALDHGTVVRSSDHRESLRQQSRLGYFNYWVVARVASVSKKCGTVRVGGIIIDGIILPGDVAEGEVVEFSVERLDIIL